MAEKGNIGKAGNRSIVKGIIPLAVSLFLVLLLLRYSNFSDRSQPDANGINPIAPENNSFPGPVGDDGNLVFAGSLAVSGDGDDIPDFSGSSE